MTDTSRWSIGTFLERVAGATSTPGGGAVAAITLASAMALIAMVAGFTKGKRFREVADEATAIGERSAALASRLTKLADRDSEAFEAVMAAYRSKAERDDPSIMDQRLLDAAEAPLDVVRETVAAIPAVVRLIEIGNPNLLSDVGVAVALMIAAVDSARLNVLINLQEVSERTRATATEAELTALLDTFQQFVADHQGPLEARILGRQTPQTPA